MRDHPLRHPRPPSRGSRASDGAVAREACTGWRVETELLITPQQAHQAALDGDPLGREDARLVGLVGGFQRHRAALAAQALQGGLLVVDERHHDGAVLRRVAALDDNRVAVENAGIDHRIRSEEPTSELQSLMRISYAVSCL